MELMFTPPQSKGLDTETVGPIIGPVMAAARLSLPELKLRALYEVNQLRLEHGLAPITELPQGQISCAMNCVLARALRGLAPRVGVTMDYIRLRQTHDDPAPKDIPLSPVLRRFIRRFDMQHYPELIEDYSLIET